jgi:transcriptional regulator with XRE-family HTH domain
MANAIRGKSLRVLRIAAGLSQAELAARAAASHFRLHQAEHGRVLLTVHELTKIARALLIDDAFAVIAATAEDAVILHNLSNGRG